MFELKCHSPWNKNKTKKRGLLLSAYLLECPWVELSFLILPPDGAKVCSALILHIVTLRSNWCYWSACRQIIRNIDLKLLHHNCQQSSGYLSQVAAETSSAEKKFACLQTFHNNKELIFKTISAGQKVNI